MNSLPHTLTKLLITILVIVVIFIGGILLPLKIIPNLITSLSSSQEEDLLLIHTDNRNTTPNQPLVLYYKDSATSTKKIEIEYPCNLDAGLLYIENNNRTSITCNKKSTLPSGKESYTLHVTTNSPDYVYIPLTVYFEGVHSVKKTTLYISSIKQYISKKKSFLSDKKTLRAY